ADDHIPQRLELKPLSVAERNELAELGGPSDLRRVQGCRGAVINVDDLERLGKVIWMGIGHECLPYFLGMLHRAAPSVVVPCTTLRSTGRCVDPRTTRR